MPPAASQEHNDVDDDDLEMMAIGFPGQAILKCFVRSKYLSNPDAVTLPVRNCISGGGEGFSLIRPFPTWPPTITHHPTANGPRQIFL